MMNQRVQHLSFLHIPNPVKKTKKKQYEFNRKSLLHNFIKIPNFTLNFLGIYVDENPVNANSIMSVIIIKHDVHKIIEEIFDN